MKSRFNTVKDYFANIKAATKTNRKFVDRATSPQLQDDDKDDRWKERIYITPALDGEEWDVLNQGNAAYIIGSDGYRIHVSIVPVLQVEGSVLSYGIDPLMPDFGHTIDALSIDEKECVYLNAKYLKEAIHPDADEVAIYVPASALAYADRSNLSAVQVISLCNETQIAWAAIMPLAYYPDFRPAPRVHLPQLLTADEVREQYEEQQQAAAVRQLATEGEEEQQQGNEVGQGQPVFAAA